ncbi:MULTISPECIES: WS/DGAT domain-containing protein [Streptomyces]|uniref:WS/DGAT domain-containing protein n=1 Tax=Streptomyces TaxID=1883 RepID=UPI001F18B6BD|nr:WS/DGAT domain-containing protein [Streptomyces sp. A1-5]UJB40402.1 DUF1298 domain-containing protein [Streptomyces sp. A1-5]
MKVPWGKPAVRGDHLTAGWKSYQRRNPDASTAIGFVFLCEGEHPTRAELLDLVSTLTGHVPTASRPGSAGILEHQVTLAEAPDETKLGEVLGECYSASLPDEGWDVWMVGYAPQRFALAIRFDHLLIDGVGGIQLLSRLASIPGTGFTPAVPVGDRDRLPSRTAPMPKSPARIGRFTVLTSARTVRALVAPLLGVPRASVLTPGTRAGADGMRYVWAQADYRRLVSCAHALGAQPNDVILAALTGALRDWYAGCGLRPDGQVTALVPISIRRTNERDTHGNRIVSSRISLPIDEPDVLARLNEIAQRSRTAKRLATHALLPPLLQLLPGPILSWGLQRNLRPNVNTLLATTVAGPPIPLRVLGRSVQQILPIVFLPAGHRVAVAISRYAGTSFVCFTTDRTLKGADSLPEMWSAAFDELCALAGPAASESESATSAAGARD